MENLATDGHEAAFCAHCGGETAHAADGEHAACAAALVMEPPRYCVACRRRMVVQVTPLGWRARCAAHGSLASA
ncbi:hypothetical protein [Actinocorallia sp. A-T 12471]|uniref:biotin synthase auxiliary protein BsaP n=1 Tax=Actinocorallia sp. A-T 12471 TaxID=3089813 RepID=UPI0029CFB5F4|nr:hypothetical protein [Actinocorallia sp. A-T 12471]MDX6738888.1 hypothetical protein [Actinocorallia sp. A-T 12471]